MTDKSNIVIIGGGHAGGMLAISLRKKKFEGNIVIISNETYLPYQRPPLSKSFLASNISEQNLLLKKDDFYIKNNIKIIYGNAIKINRNQKSILLDDKNILQYDRLVLATGTKLNKIKNNNLNSKILYLKNINDAINIKKSMLSAKKICIIGGGYIGLEIASIAIKKGLKVKIIESEDRIMKRVACKEISHFLETKHKSYGVDIILNNSVQNINKENKLNRITLNNNKSLFCDLVIGAIGIKPNDELAKDCGLECENGINVNSHGQTSDNNIFAIGDCSYHPNNILNIKIRLESVQNAVEQAQAISNFIIDKKSEYSSIPWFWSDQYNIKIQMAGISSISDNYFIKGSIKKESFSVFYTKEEVIVAIETINNTKDFIFGKKLISSQNTISKKDILSH